MLRKRKIFLKQQKKFLVPPSNISQTIKRLEKELETPLFERCTNKIKLNDARLHYYKNAKTALELLENEKEFCIYAFIILGGY